MPVYLPALSLLVSVFSGEFLKPIAQGPLPREAAALFAHQLVFRSGSSNVRAREEAANALLHLARCEAVGAPALSRTMVKPLSHSKSKDAAVGRLELLRTIVAEFGIGAAASGLELVDVLAFTLPLCEAASGAARDAAVGLVLDMRADNPKRVEEMIEEMRPSVLALIQTRLAPPDKSSTLSVSGRRLPPIGVAPDSASDAVTEFRGTPPGQEARARARATASELGVRGPPAARKKASKKAVYSPTSELGRAVSSPSSPAGALAFNQTEEELMAEILQDSK